MRPRDARGQLALEDLPGVDVGSLGWASWADLFPLLRGLPTLAGKSAGGLVDLRHAHANEPGHGNAHGDVHAGLLHAPVSLFAWP